MSKFEIQEPHFEKEGKSEGGINLSSLAVRERSVTLFFLLAVIIAGAFAYFNLGRAEDPSFTVKVFTVTAAWPGATAQEMQDLVAEPLEKRMQELTYYDHVDTFTRPGLEFLTVTLKDYAPPAAVPEEFYQGRKKIQDEASRLPQGVLPPVLNDEYTDVTFAVYSLEAPGLPLRLLTREAETLRQDLLHVPGVKKVNVFGERPERIFVQFSYDRIATLGVSARDIFDALVRQNAVTPVWFDRYSKPTGVYPPRRSSQRPRQDSRHAHNGRRKTFETLRHCRCGTWLRGSRDVPGSPQWSTRHDA
jgi:multidrug efflux pump subunit AcrB